MNNAPPVVITRPMAQAGVLAELVAAIGRTPVFFPLLEIRPLDDIGPLKLTLQHLDRYAMVAFVSPNAINAAFGLLKTWPAQIAIAIMGEGSRAALSHHGVTADNARIISPRDPRRTDSQTLLEALDVEALRGKRVLIIRGESGRELLADALRAAGVDVHQVAAYKRIAPELDVNKKQQLQHLLNASCDWIITSSEALRILLQMVEQVEAKEGVRKLQRQHVIVPHARIQETALSLGFEKITLTASGDEYILAALQS